jgi:glutamine synthetase
MGHTLDAPPTPSVPPATTPPLPACRLAQLMGKTRAFWTIEDLVEVVMEQEIRLVSLMHIGGDGWLKTLDFVPRDLAHLRDVLTGGERADGSSIFAGKGISARKSDIVFRPRVDTAFLHPFASLPTLVLLWSHYDRNGTPLAESPEPLVHRAFERMTQETGIELHALGEVEFFLGKRPEESDI